MLSAIAGLLAAAAGLWGMARWWPDFLAVARGLLPVCLFLGGLIAVAAGLSILKGPDAGKGSGGDKKPSP